MSDESAKLSSGTVIDTSASFWLVTCQPLKSLDVWVIMTALTSTVKCFLTNYEPFSATGS